MRSSKINPLIQFLTLTITMSLMVACTLKDTAPYPGQNSQAGSDATFSVSDISGTSTVTETTANFNIPIKRNFNFKACLLDLKNAPFLSGLEFTVVGDQNTDTPVSTDTHGCINWSETISYNYLAASKYVSLERKIKARGINRGEAKITIAINPWMHGENIASVMNPSLEKVTNLVTANETLKALAGDDQKASSLWLSTVNFTIEEKNLGNANFQLEFNLSPQLRLTNTYGQRVLQALSAGSFRVVAYLINTRTENGQEKREIIATQDGGQVFTMKNTNLTGSIPLKIPLLPTRGQLLAGFDLIPVDAPHDLQSFSGLYLMGEYDQLKGRFSGNLRKDVDEQNGNFKIADFAQAADFLTAAQQQTALTQNKPQSSEPYTKSGVIADFLSPRFVRYTQETATDRTLQFTVQACLKNSSDSKYYRGIDFTVTKIKKDKQGNREEATLRTEDNGCFTWSDEIHHEYYKCENLKISTVRIRNKDLNFDQEFTLVFNPWDMGFTFGRDSRQVEKTDLAANSQSEAACQKAPSYIFFNSFNLTSYNDEDLKHKKYEYSVDADMNLTLKRNFILTMAPAAIRYNSMTQGQQAIEKLRDGVYLLKLALQRNSFEDPGQTSLYMTSVEKYITIEAGQVTTPLQLEIKDLRLLSSTNSIMLQILPVDSRTGYILSDTGLLTPTYKGPIVLATENPYGSLVESNESATDFINKNKPQSTLIAVDPEIRINDYAKNYNFEVLNLAENDKATQNFLSQMTNPLWARQQSGLLGGLFKAHPPLDINVLEKAIEDGKVDAEFMDQLCEMWFTAHYDNLVPNKRTLQTTQDFIFVNQCKRQVKANPKAYFDIGKKYFVSAVGGSDFVPPGLQFNYSVGTSFGFTRTHSDSTANTFSWSISGSLNATPFPEVFKFLSLGTSVGYTLSRTLVEDHSSSNAYNVTASTPITIMKNSVQVTLKSYNECLSIQPNPTVFAGKDNAYYWNQNLTAEEKTKLMTRGFLICTGKTNTTPVDKVENYYQINQALVAGQQQDASDLRNRPFSLVLRSDQDFANFLTIINAVPSMPGNSTQFANNQADVTLKMMKALNSLTPSSTGVYSEQ